MAKRAGLGASRAARKEARARKRRAVARGLPVDAEPAARAAKPPVWVEVQRKRSIEKAASKFPFGKLALVLALLMAAVWAAARFRHGLLE